jgi:hypothetical protein
MNAELAAAPGADSAARAADRAAAELAAAYRERARLISHLAHVYPAVICANDPATPGYPVIYFSTSAGQLSWHLAEADLDLFDHVPVVAAGDPAAPVWDGHGIAEKYARLQALGEHWPEPVS